MMRYYSPFAVLALANAETFNPLQKVQTLLQNMKSEQELEQKKDEEMYKKMDCWCTDNRKNKNENVENAKDVIQQRTADAEKHEAGAKEAKLAMEQAKEARAAAEEDLQDVNARNEKDAQEFADAAEELNFNIQSINQAVQVISDATGQKANLAAQKEKEALVQLQAGLKVAESPYSRKLQADLLEMFAAFPDSSMSQLRTGEKDLGLVGGPGYSSYNAQSGQIFGMLQQMSEDMQKELAAFQQEEDERIATVKQMVENLNEQISTVSASVTRQQQVMAENQMAAAQARQEVTETKNSLGENEQFLLDLEDRCKENTDIFKANLEMRGEEIKAIGQALAILNSDSVRELFDNKKDAFFMQMSSRRAVSNPARAKAAALLRKQGSLNLLALASTVKNSAFESINEAIDKMVEDIKAQLSNDVESRDFCIEETHQNKMDSQDTAALMQTLSKLIDTKTAEVAANQEKITAAAEEVQTTYESIQESGEDRAEESKAFQANQANGNKIDFVLQGVLAKLKAVYAKEEALVQLKTVSRVSMHDDEKNVNNDPPASLKAAEHNSGAGGVLTLIAEIIGDNKKELATAVSDNQFAQDSYNKMTASSFAEVQDLNEMINSQKQAIALADNVIGETKQEKGNAYNKLESLNQAKINLGQQCDFLVDNFDVRQESMKNEIEAINGAKAILSGAIFD